MAKKNAQFIEEFPLNPKNILSSFDVFGMSSQEFGIFCKLLFVSWIQKPQCYLPLDEHNIRELCNLSEEDWQLSKNKVIKKFIITELHGTQYIHNRVLLDIYNGIIREDRATKSEQLSQLTALTNYTFDQFWEDYQKKVGDKKRLMPKWLKLSDADREAIKADVPKRIAAQPNKQFRPNAETYLNGRLWENEIIDYTNNNAKTSPSNADYNSQADNKV